MMEDGTIPGLDMAVVIRRHNAATKSLYAG
jgi:hypothetical protein